MLRGFTLDVDGVLIRGKVVLNPGVEALKLLRRMSIPFLLCTNGGGCTEEVKAKYLSRLLQFEISASEVCVAHTPFRTLAPYYTNKPVLIIGRDEEETRDVAISNGLKNFFTIRDIAWKYPNIHWQAPGYQREHEGDNISQINYEEKLVPHIPKFSAVLLLIDSGMWSLDLQILCDVLRDGDIFSEEGEVNTQIPLYISNMDYLYAHDYAKPRFGTGCFVKCLEELYLFRYGEKLKYEVLGKPSERMCRYIENEFLNNHRLCHSIRDKVSNNNNIPELSVPNSVIYMIGDNPETDVRMVKVANGDILNNIYKAKNIEEMEGKRNEGEVESGSNIIWKSVLVKTGVSKDNNHPLDECRADYLYEDVNVAVRNIMISHGFTPN